MFKGCSTGDYYRTCSFSPLSVVGFKPDSPYLVGALNTNLPHFLVRTCPVLCHELLPACPLYLSRAVISSPLRQPCVLGWELLKGNGVSATPPFWCIRALFLPRELTWSPHCYWGSTWIYRTCRNITCVESTVIY